MEAGAESNVFDGGLRGFQQVLGGGQARFNKVLMGRDASLLRKDPGEVVGAHVRLSRQRFQGQIALKMLVDVGDGVRHGGAVDLVASVLVGRIEEVVQKLRDSSGKLPFEYFRGGTEYVVNLLKLSQRLFHIFCHQQIVMAGDDFFVIVPGQPSVEVEPQGVPGLCASVAVGLVAVQQYELACPGSERLSGNGDAAAAFGDVHDEKAVETVPADPVAGVVVKISHGGGIKVQPGGQGAGRVDVIVRLRKDFGFL